jgi:hypothetical protein
MKINVFEKYGGPASAHGKWWRGIVCVLAAVFFLGDLFFGSYSYFRWINIDICTSIRPGPFVILAGDGALYFIYPPPARRIIYPKTTIDWSTIPRTRPSPNLDLYLKVSRYVVCYWGPNGFGDDVVGVPCWIPLPFVAVVAAWLWRTRKKMKVRGFPVLPSPSLYKKDCH